MHGNYWGCPVCFGGNRQQQQLGDNWGQRQLNDYYGGQLGHGQLGARQQIVYVSAPAPAPAELKPDPEIAALYDVDCGDA